MIEAVKVPMPWHFWIVAVISTLWNAFGTFDYFMTQTRNPAYLAQFSPDQRAYFESFPAWAEGFWAFGVWGALAGSLLLLARSRFAVIAFAVSLAGLAGSTVYQHIVTTAPADMRTPPMIVMSAVIWIIAIALLLYARAMQAPSNIRHRCG